MKAAVLRPEPGNSATAARLEALGFATLRLPLFAAVPVNWTPPAPSRFDATLLTSANAVRHAGAQLSALAGLPVVAVGSATAAAAREVGLHVELTGVQDARAAVAVARETGFTHLLHLAGREHVGDLAVAETIVVYASTATAPEPTDLATLAGSVALLHSPRAARRLGELLDAAAVARDSIVLAALSDAIAAAAGDGWREVHAAAMPTDEALTTLAAAIVRKP